ncbi:type II toxin-antitoxin system PemK/MazF family toxin [Oceanobacillus jeddahense]|uniref:Type II toxin-antitoxin system PemK/MazF family toxin n=1 Tax=Oceanobacillus jeddahense TaxID=1462527 RepID=A0ABY5JTH8_9BACI|nr:type II toxin-antitoxin system PemK/MazF family toxin [Oceanobacillus jeddahense]UUI02772.1 type II toxin-antitoxin system PemK/MazF family toxin [Oceanobacillus jeddahense]
MQSTSYRSRRDLKDEREFQFGDVWKVDDRDVSIPQIDKLNSRSIHKERWVVVVSNNSENTHPLCPIVTVAPLSHRTDLKRTLDLDIYRDSDNVKVDCVLQLKLSQPILKVDLFEYQGSISDNVKTN